MNREPYAIALDTALTEIQKAYPGIHHSFLFTNTGSMISKDPETDQETIDNVLEAFEELKEKTEAIGGLKNFSATTEKGKLIISSLDDMYLVLATSEKADETQIHSIKDVILPIILKSVEQISSTHLQTPPETEQEEEKIEETEEDTDEEPEETEQEPEEEIEEETEEAEEAEEEQEEEPEEEPSLEKELIVDVLTGFFAGDSVKIDAETLTEWTNEASGKGKTKVPIDHVRVETFAGNSTLCKVKEISDGRMKRKNKIRIPEKICTTLALRKGDKVKVKPLL
jgi:chemotaxis protein histidine kinase CheA